jgi:general stress protein 26
MSQTLDKTNTNVDENLSHLVSLLREFQTASLVTRERTGTLHSRPMSVAAVDDDASIWFFTSKGSPKVAEISSDERALVSFQGTTRFASLYGICEVSADRDMLTALWQESYRVWYDSNHDPEIVLLRFTPYEAEYWDTSGLRGLKYILRAAKAYVSGRPLSERPEGTAEPATHAKLQL